MIHIKEVINLSSFIPTFAELILLRKGLKFVPTSSVSIDKAKLLTDEALEKLENTFRWAGLYGSTTSITPVIKKLLAPSSASDDPPALSQGSINYLALVKKDIYNALDLNRTVKWNYTKNDMRAFYKLCTTKEIELVTRDKNLGVMIMPCSWSINEGQRQLDDLTTYAIADDAMVSRSHLALNNFIIKHQKSFKKLGPSPLNSREFHGLRWKTIFALREKRYPRFHLLAKTQKVVNLNDAKPSDIKGRPIIGAYGGPTTFLSIYAACNLQPFLADEPVALNSTKTLVNDLANFTLPPGINSADLCVGTADVEALYPSIPIKEGCTAVKAFLISKCKRPLLPKEVAYINFLVLVLKLVLSNNIFSFQKILYLQLVGTAMGTNCAPAFAIIYLIMLERKLDYTGILLYKRYIDDLLLIAFNRSRAESFFADFNVGYPHIKLVTNTDTRQDFLNLTIWWDKDTRKCVHRPYAKRFNQFLYLPFSSFHPPHMKRAFVKSGLIVLVINSSQEFLYSMERSLFYKRLRARGYPLSFLAPIFASVSYNDRSTYLAKKTTASAAGLSFLSLPYNARFASCAISSITHRHWNILKVDEKIGRVLTRAPILSWSKDSTISDKINSLEKTKHVGQP
jgi:hypothetical protein